MRGMQQSVRDGDVRLDNPPAFELTFCISCRSRINLGEDGYTIKPGGEYFWASCFGLPMQ